MSYNFSGVAVYKIERNGSIVGEYTNDAVPTDNKKFFEMARKKDELKNDLLNNPNEIFGEYVCHYFNYRNKVVTCDLQIQPLKNDKNGTYHFIWSIYGVIGKEATTFEGKGIRTGNIIEVTYTDV